MTRVMKVLQQRVTAPSVPVDWPDASIIVSTTILEPATSISSALAATAIASRRQTQGAAIVSVFIFHECVHLLVVHTSLSIVKAFRIIALPPKEHNFLYQKLR